MCVRIVPHRMHTCLCVHALIQELVIRRLNGKHCSTWNIMEIYDSYIWIAENNALIHFVSNSKHTSSLASSVSWSTGCTALSTQVVQHCAYAAFSSSDGSSHATSGGSKCSQVAFSRALAFRAFRDMFALIAVTVSDLARPAEAEKR